MKDKKIDLVIARYNEPLDWLNKYKDRKFNRIFVYNKGATDVTCPLEPVDGKVIYTKLKNVGRCDHTYIHHIINHYDDLGDVTLFIKGSTVCPARTGYFEPGQFKKILEKAFETGTTAFVGEKFPPDIAKSMGYFTLSAYTAYCKINVNSTTKVPLKEASPRPFSAWYKKHFPNVHGETRVSFRGVFAISKEHIHHRNKEDYQPFLDELAVDSNPEAGHYIERSWFALFYKIPDECFYNFSELKGGKTTKKKRFKRNKYTRAALKKIKDISVL